MGYKFKSTDMGQEKLRRLKNKNENPLQLVYYTKDYKTPKVVIPESILDFYVVKRIMIVAKVGFYSPLAWR